jgi:hypothetical protein
MAATIPEYAIPLLQKQQEAAQLLGINMLNVDPQTWRVNLTVLLLLSIVYKALSDKGLITDAEWISALGDSLTTDLGTWPAWLLQQQAPPA